MASWLIRLSPLPFIGIARPSPPRTTQPPAKLFQKPKAGVRMVVFPASGWVPVGVTTASSPVKEKSFVSCSKKRGVNEISPNPEWLFVVAAVGLFGLMIGRPLVAGFMWGRWWRTSRPGSPTGTMTWPA